MTPQLRHLGSGRSFIYPVRFGNATRGYKELVIPDDAIKFTPQTQRFEDRQALDGTYRRQVFVAAAATWSFPFIVEDYDTYAHGPWFQSIRETGMLETFDFWDHRCDGQYVTGTVNGITYPIQVKIVSLGEWAPRAHDPFKLDTDMILRESQL